MKANLDSVRSRRLLPALAALGLMLLGTTAVSAQNLASFAVLAGSAITNTGPTVIAGNIGVSPGSAISGFPPGIVNAPFTIYQNNAVAAQAQSDLTTAYNVLAGRPFTTDLTGQNLGGMTLVAGVYNFNTSAQLTGTVTLDAQGNSNATFVFNIGSTLTTASAASVVLVNGALGANVYYRVGSSATLGAATLFKGKILALTSITLVTGATIDCGAALARNGAVTMDTNFIGLCPTAAVIVGGGTDDDDTDVGDAIDDFVTGGGDLPLGFEVLGLLTPEELAAALIELSGEIGSGVGPSAFGSMDSFLNVVGESGGPGASRATYTNAGGPATVSVMGYAPEPAPIVAFEDIGDVAIEAAPIWEVWAAVHGGYSVTNGDPAVPTHDRIARNYGIAVGVENQFTADTGIGFAVGGGGADFSLAGMPGGGRSTIANVAVHSRTDFETAYISGALAYALHQVTTDRYVTFAGLDHFRGTFNAHNVAAEVEAGYKLGLVTPYVALRGQTLFTPAYSETTVSGNSTFALSYDARMATAVRTELGAKFDWTAPPAGDTSVKLSASAAWAHYFYGGGNVNASFQALPGSTFVVAGAASPTDTLLVSAAAEMGLDNGVSITGSLDGEFARNAQSYGGAVKLGYHW